MRRVRVEKVDVHGLGHHHELGVLLLLLLLLLLTRPTTATTDTTAAVAAGAAITTVAAASARPHERREGLQVESRRHPHLLHQRGVVAQLDPVRRHGVRLVPNHS